jgi:hypothetical protein
MSVIRDNYSISRKNYPPFLKQSNVGGSKTNTAFRDRERIDRVTQAFLVMKKFDIAKLLETYEGK